MNRLQDIAERVRATEETSKVLKAVRGMTTITNIAL